MAKRGCVCRQYPCAFAPLLATRASTFALAAAHLAQAQPAAGSGLPAGITQRPGRPAVIRQDAPSLDLMRQAVKLSNKGAGLAGKLPDLLTVSLGKNKGSIEIAPDQLWAKMRAAGGIHAVSYNAPNW